MKELLESKEPTTFGKAEVCLNHYNQLRDFVKKFTEGERYMRRYFFEQINVGGEYHKENAYGAEIVCYDRDEVLDQACKERDKHLKDKCAKDYEVYMLKKEIEDLKESKTDVDYNISIWEFLRRRRKQKL